MPRPRKFDHVDTLNKVKLAFWEHGFNGVSMDDVGRQTNMNRGSIYNAFGDKRALYLDVLELYGQQHYGAAVHMIRESENAPIAVRNLYDAAFKGMKDDHAQWGCFMCNASVEIAPFDTEVATIVKEYIGMLTDAFTTSLEASNQDSNDITRLKNVAEQLTASYIGFNVMARTGMPLASLRRISDSAVELATTWH